MSTPLVLKYSSMENISFRGEIEVDGLSREEFDKLSGSEQVEVLSEQLFQLVDIDVKD